MKVWIKKLGHWTDSNPGFSDHWVDDGFDVRDYSFAGATEVEVKTQDDRVQGNTDQTKSD